MGFDKTIKNKTMEDLVFKDIAKESHLKTTESGIIIEKETPIIGIDVHSNVASMQKDIWVKYNKSVVELDKRYSEGIELVNGDILVRLFKKPIIDKYGFTKQHNVQAQLRNGAYKTVPDKLAFNFIGIVVNTDKILEQKFPKKTIVQISPDASMTQVFAEEFQILKYGYFRDGDEDKNYSELGYVLLRQNQILSIVKDFDIDSYTEIKELK